MTYALRGAGRQMWDLAMLRPSRGMGINEGHKMGQIGNLVVVGLLTIASGLLDARGFVYASRAWPGGHLDVKMALASLLSFAGGVSVYVLAVKFMQNAGIHGVALQSGIWFVVTAVGIAAMDGTLLQWTRTQQVVGVAVAVALGWLISTTRAGAG
jgi:hypothetical protein